MSHHLEDAPAIGRALAEGLVPSLRAVSLAERVQGTRDPMLPFSVAHRDALDAMHEVIGRNVDEAVRIMGVKGPEASHRRLAADVNARGLGAGLTASQVYDELQALSKWALGHLESIAYLVIAGDAHDEIVEVVKRGRALAGLAHWSRRTARRVCVACLERTVEVQWLDDGGVQVRCQHCHLSTDEFDPSLLLGEAVS